MRRVGQASLVLVAWMASMGCGTDAAATPTGGATDARATVDPAHASPPNVLVFLTDDTRSDWLGYEGHPFVETPTYDRLADEGARFTQSFVSTSLCCPSRASLLTGLYAHRHGITTNLEGDLDPALPTFPSILRAAGWRAAFVGKWHMGEDGAPRPGFDHWVSFAGQGTYFDPTLVVDGEEVATEGYVTDLLTDHAVAWIEEQDGEAPFCLIVSHKATHAPMAPPERLWDHYADRPIEPPLAARDDLAGKPEVLRRAALHGYSVRKIEARANDPIPDRVPPPSWEIANYVRRYLETVVSVDESLARIVDVLERRELRADTILVVTSDNGYVFGEHQAPDKRLAWEESIRVPLIVSAPGRLPGGLRIDELVLNVDLAPTLLELAGLEPPQSMQGRSFAPLLRGEETPWRERFFYSYFRETPLPGIPTTLALRTREWKYVVYADALAPNEELYDLAHDPHEMTNLAADEAYAERLATMRTGLAEERERLAFELPEHARPPHIEPSEPETVLHVEGTLAPGPLEGIELEDRAFRLHVTVQPGEDGTLLEYGYANNGFTLRIVDGRPVFELFSLGRTRRLVGTPLGDTAVELEAGLDLDGRAFLDAPGGPLQRAPLAVDPPRKTGDVLTITPEGARRISRLDVVYGVAHHPAVSPRKVP